MAARVQNVLECAAFITVALNLFLDATQAVLWSCSQNATNVPVDVKKVSGSWYEVARFPQSDVPACLEVIAPNAIENSEYTLQLDYVNNVNNRWKRNHENVTFPWNDETESGLFMLSYSEGNVTVNVIFKYIGTFQNLAIVCGYSGVAPGVSILRLLSRDRTMASDNMKMIEYTMANYGLSASQLTWVEQGEKCNGASSLSSSHLLGLIALFVLFKMVNVSK